MAYTPPANPVNIDFNRQPYNAPVNPVHIDFDTAYAEGLTHVTESAAAANDQAAAAVWQALQGETTGADSTASASFTTSLAVAEYALPDSAQSAALSLSGSIAEATTATDDSAAASVWACVQAEPAAADTQQTVESFAFRASSSYCCPVNAAKPTGQPLAIVNGTVKPGWREIAAPVEQGVWLDVKACAPLDVLKMTLTGVLSNQDDGVFSITKACAPLDVLALSRTKTCADVAAAASLADSLAVDTAQTDLVQSTTCAPVDDTQHSYHVLLRTVYDDPALPYAPAADFLLSPSSTATPTTVTLRRYVPPVSTVGFNFDPPGYAPPHPVNANFGEKDLSDINHVFNVFPGFGSAQPAFDADFNLPYTTLSHAARVVEQVGVLRTRTCAPLEAFNVARYRQCATVDPARRPPPGVSDLHIDPPRDPPPEPPVIYIIPDRTVYMINHATTTTLLDGTPVPLDSLSLSLDADSFAWNFRGKMADKDAIALVQQPANGEPVQLIITVNGIEFKIIVERIDHNRQFGDRQILLNGRSLTALLGQPYQVPMSSTQASDLTVQQLADLQLPEHWTINWNVPTWLVPSGAFSYTAQTPIQVLMGIATDIGAVIKPHRTEQKMTFQRRYPVGPWQYGQAAADLTIPEAAIGSITLRPPVPIDINGVYVHGGDIGGVIGWCRLSGTDGGRLAQTVNNSLMTDVDGARLLGERILAANQPQPAVQSFTLPFDNVDFPLVELGWLVQVTVDNLPIRGIVNAVSLNVAFGSVSQTIQIGEETPNTWSSFRDLLPRDPLLVGKLSVTDGLSSLVTLLDGGVIRVRGTGTVGNQYYVRGGKIENDAPNLTQFEIVV